MLLEPNHRLRAELDHQELAALQRFMIMLHEEPHLSNPKVDMSRVSRGLAGQILVPVTVGRRHPDVHLALMKRPRGIRV